jgi:DNA-binding response OmpR family regulator
LGARPFPSPQQPIVAREVPLIAVKPSGVIHVGDEPRMLNLSRNQRTILERLWAARPERVNYEELIMDVYGRAAWENLDQRNASKETLQRTVQRLKKLLEDGGGVEYIRVEVGLGYRMVHTIDG